MRIIDAHVHLYPGEVADDPSGWAASRGERHWAALCTRSRRDGRKVQTFPAVAELLRAMDAAGIERAVLLGWYWEKPGTCSWQNRFYATVVRQHPDRLSGFASVHPGAGQTVTLDEVRRAHGEGLIGLGELSPHSQGYGVEHPVFSEVLALAGELAMPVNLHVTDPETRPFPGRIETPGAHFLRLARDFPSTALVLAHWGGLLALREPAFRSMANVYYDTAASPLLYDEGIWERFTSALGSERVMFGSDFPLNLYPKLDDFPGFVRLLREAREAGMGEGVLGGNAARLLGI
jgi:uncharacterized protein